MSENKVRYFLHDDGQVLWSRYSEVQQEYEASPYHTEVQVVPGDAIVIRDEQLTTFEAETVDGRTYWNQPGLMGSSHEDSRDARALEHEARLLLAKAKYLREHPPVDEERVDAMRRLVGRIPGDIVDDVAKGRGGLDRLAKWLVERDVRVEAKS